MKRKVLSLLLALVLVISMIPAAALPVSAAKTQITDLALTFRSQNDIPAVGEAIVYSSAGAVQVSDARVGLTASGLLWRDENGTVINDTFDDYGIYFEAGRTYYAELTAKAMDPASCQFTESTAITLTNPGAFSYTAKVVDITDTQGGHYATIRLTVTMNGVRTYPNIAKVVFADSAAPSAVGGLPSTEVYYNNCYVLEQGWYDENSLWTNTAQEGHTYTNKIVLKAKSGYAFDENVAAVRTYAGAHQTPVSKVLTENDTVLTLTYTYTVDSMTRVGAVELQLAYYYVDTTPIAGHPAASQYKMIGAPAGAPYKMISENGTFWWDENGKGVSETDIFQAGKTYYFEVGFGIKDEMEATHRFTKGALTASITGDGYTGRGLQKIERVEYSSHDDTYVRLRYYYTAQFPAGVGESYENPAVCTNFAEFKYAMESSSIRHVALQEFQENLPKLEGADQAAAVFVKNDKQLYLQGNTILSELVSPGYHNYGSLLQLPVGASLTVRGPGSLKFHAYGSDSKNAVIHNMGGTVRMISGTLTGSFITRAQGVAIWQDSGELVVNGGNLRGENTLPGTAKNHYAVYVNGGSATVKSGIFKAENKSEGQGSCYGLGIGEDADVTLQGGTFQGIHLPTSSTPLSNYVDEDVYTVLSDGQWINPTSQYSQEYTASNKEVRVLRRVKKVTASVASPVAGADIEDTNPVFFTEGYSLADDYPRWYKDGQRVTSGTFEAGVSYELVLRLMADTENGFEFAPDVTATVNGASADIATVGTNLKSHCISVTYQFPPCPRLLKQVDLTIDAPKQNGTPDQYVTCGSTAYKQALVGDNMFDTPLQWQESSNGSTWTNMKATDTFTVGKHYRVYVDIMPANGYEFALDPQLDPAVVATVNGFYGAVYRYPEADPAKLISVCFTFGILNDTVIEEIRISGVTEPVVDEKPNYICAVEGSGYQLDTNYDDAYEDNVIQNGMGWWDYTADNWVKPDDTFQINHEYKAVFYVKTLTGYEFSTTGKYYEPNGWGYINDNYATFSKQSLAQNNQTLSWVFPCQPKTVKAVGVTMNTPKSGQPFDFVPKTDSKYYSVTEIVWTDEDGNDLTAADRAQQGSTYRMHMIVEPNEEEGKDLCKFVNDKTTATVNGVQVVKKGSWDEVVSGPKKVYIFYTFQCGNDWLTGDFDDDGDKDTNDAVYLLLNTMFGDGDYPIPAGAAKDMNSDGKVDTNDAVYLLLHVMFGAEDYPL